LIGKLKQGTQKRLWKEPSQPAWLEPYTPQIYFGSTIANALVWAGMCLIGIKLWEVAGNEP